jgi:hypothetical protein
MDPENVIIVLGLGIPEKKENVVHVMEPENALPVEAQVYLDV